MKQNSGLAHCVHHDIHWEYCYNYQKRVEFIKENKPKEEQELRLKLFKLLPNKLVPGRESAEWKACIKAVKSYNKALQSCIMAREAYDKAKVACKKRGESFENDYEIYNKKWKALDKAGDANYRAWDAYYSKYANELQILHDKMFPDCPWDGESIF